MAMIPTKITCKRPESGWRPLLILCVDPTDAIIDKFWFGIDASEGAVAAIKANGRITTELRHNGVATMAFDLVWSDQHRIWIGKVVGESQRDIVCKMADYKEVSDTTFGL